MRAVYDIEPLNAALAVVGSVAEGVAPPHPATVRFHSAGVGGDIATVLSGANGSQTISATVNALEATSGTMNVDARAMMEIAKSAAGETLTISHEGASAVVRCGMDEFQVATTEDSDVLPVAGVEKGDGATLALDAEDLLTACEIAKRSAGRARGDARLAGVNLRISSERGVCVCLATNGKRAVALEVGDGVGAGGDASATLQHPAVDHVRGVLKAVLGALDEEDESPDATIWIPEGGAAFRMEVGVFNFGTTVMAGQYPAVEGVFPSAIPSDALMVNRKDALDALRRASACAESHVVLTRRKGPPDVVTFNGNDDRGNESKVTLPLIQGTALIDNAYLIDDVSTGMRSIRSDNVVVCLAGGKNLLFLCDADVPEKARSVIMPCDLTLTR